MTDPVVRRMVIDRGAWERAIRDNVPLDPTIGYIAMIVASFTDFTTGTNAFPGEQRLACVTGRSTRTVRNALAWLDEHGLLMRVHQGGRNPNSKYADVYNLSLPAPLADKLGLWPTDDREQWIERSTIKLAERPPTRERYAQATHRKPVTTHRQRVT